MANANENILENNLLCCPITYDLFRDPVLAQDGFTYERQVIEEWIRNHGTSPMTRQPLSIEQLHPNRKVKELVDVFEQLLHQKDYQFKLDVDIKIMEGWPMFQAFGKTIYMAEWLRDKNNRPKVILLKLYGARARKEASFYANLSRHPHIIRTFGFVNDKDNPDKDKTVLLLQEYAPQGNFYDLLQRRKNVRNEKILIQIFLQIIDAMMFLAYNHIVHGDLACRNVLIFHFDENQPERNVIKITDFGLSRHSQLYSRTPGAVSATTTLNIVPIRYAAPEVLLPNATADVYTEKSDIYSMGVLMWEAYSRGSIPWEDIEDDKHVVERVQRGDLLPKPSNCSQSIWSIITKLWSKAPIDRPTFNELKYLLNEQYYSLGGMLENKNLEVSSINVPHGPNWAQINQPKLVPGAGQSHATQPTSMLFLPAQTYNNRSNNNAASSSLMSKQQIFDRIFKALIQPSRAPDGRLMDEEGYYNEDGSRSFF